MKNRLLLIFLLLGCMIGYASSKMSAITPEQLQAVKLKKTPAPPTKAAPASKPTLGPKTPATPPAAPAKIPATIAAPAKAKAESPEVAAARERYGLLEKIIAYHNKKHNERVADDKLAKQINAYFRDHLNEIAHDSSTTELLRVFVKDLILSISTQAYEIADNVLDLSTDKKDIAEKAIAVARTIAQKNIDHLPQINVLIALSKALSNKENKDTSINLPEEVQTLLGKSNTAIAGEEFKIPEAQIKAEFQQAKEAAKASAAAAPTAAAKPAPASESKPQEEPKPAEETDTPPPPLMPTAPAAPVGRPPSPSPAELQARRGSLTPIPQKTKAEPKLTKAATVLDAIKQKGQLTELKKKEQDNTITNEEKVILKKLKEFYPEALAPKSPIKQLPPPQQQEDLGQLLQSAVTQRGQATAEEPTEKEVLEQKLHELEKTPSTNASAIKEIKERLQQLAGWETQELE